MCRNELRGRGKKECGWAGRMGGIYFLGLFILFLLMVLHGYFLELADWLAGAVVLGLVRFIFLLPPPDMHVYPLSHIFFCHFFHDCRCHLLVYIYLSTQSGARGFLKKMKSDI